MKYAEPNVDETKRVHANAPTVKDVEEIAKKIVESSQGSQEPTSSVDVNVELDEGTEYEDLENISVNGETYVVPKGEGGAVLTLDFAGKTSLQLTNEIATNIKNLVYDKIIIENYYASVSSNKPNKLICIKNYLSELAYNGDYNIQAYELGKNYYIHSMKPIYYNYGNSYSNGYIAGGYIINKIRIRDLGLKISSSNVATISNLSNETSSLEYVMNKITLGAGESTKTGSLTINYMDTGGFNNISSNILNTVRWRDLRLVVADTDLNITVPLYFKELVHNSTITNARVYYIGESIDTTTGAVTNRYILSVASNKSYTLTKVSL
jgi:hypothetical protein